MPRPARTQASDPRNTSAPLPPDWSTYAFPGKEELIAEARRAAVELVWALHRQRTAWAKFAKIKAALDDRNISYVDNERSYVLASSDVKWWRAEVASRASALTALLAAYDLFK